MSAITRRILFSCNISQGLERRFSSSTHHSRNNKLLWVQAGNSSIADSVKIEAIKKGWTIVSTQRDNKKYNNFDSNKIKNIKLGDNDIYEIEKIKSLMEKHIGDFEGDIVFFNAVGGAHIKKALNHSAFVKKCINFFLGKRENMRETTLAKLNKNSALCFAESINLFLNGKNGIRSTLIHCSSIAASLSLEDEYASLKKETDEELMREHGYGNIDQILCFRVGYVVHSLLEGNRIKAAHAFSPEQLAKHSPVQPVIMSEERREAIIYPVHIIDVATAVINVPDICLGNGGKVRKIVDIVGPDGLDQSKFFEFYTNIFKKKFIQLEISARDFEIIAKNFPYGHIASYAAKYVRVRNPKLDENLFKKLVKRELTSIEAVKSEVVGINKRDLKVYNPFFSYGLVILENIYNNGRASYEPTRVLLSIVTKAFSEYFKYKKECINHRFTILINRRNSKGQNKTQ